MKPGLRKIFDRIKQEPSDTLIQRFLVLSAEEGDDLQKASQLLELARLVLPSFPKRALEAAYSAFACTNNHSDWRVQQYSIDCIQIMIRTLSDENRGEKIDQLRNAMKSIQQSIAEKKRKFQPPLPNPTPGPMPSPPQVVRGPAPSQVFAQIERSEKKPRARDEFEFTVQDQPVQEFKSKPTNDRPKSSVSDSETPVAAFRKFELELRKPKQAQEPQTEISSALTLDGPPILSFDEPMDEIDITQPKATSSETNQEVNVEVPLTSPSKADYLLQSSAAFGKENAADESFGVRICRYFRGQYQNEKNNWRSVNDFLEAEFLEHGIKVPKHDIANLADLIQDENLWPEARAVELWGKSLFENASQDQVDDIVVQARLKSQQICFFTTYCNQLVDSGRARRALYLVERRLDKDVSLGWAKALWECLIGIWSKLNLDPADWKEEDGVKALQAIIKVRRLPKAI